MIRNVCGVAAFLCVTLGLLQLSSCARSQQLTGVTISPSSYTYYSPAVAGAQQTPVTLTAYGTYIHPPETKVITSQVTWSIDNPLVANISSGGQLTDGTVCGVANITATAYTDGKTGGNVQVGTMTVTVQGPASQGCPQGTATNNLSIDISAGATDGTIVSSPSGINCGATCTATFPSSSSVALTATPNSGKSFLGWGSGCTTVSGNTCNVTMNGDVTVQASFN